MGPPTHQTASMHRGVKRKRASGPARPAVKQETPAELIAKKLHHGLHEVRKAAKKAVAFEIRKLVKRLKQARSQNSDGKGKGDDPTEMERQLAVLKSIEHEPFANTAFRTKILKDKLLSQNADIQSALAEKIPSSALVTPQEPGSSAAKVHGRLLSSKIIAEAVHTVVDSLKEILDPSLAKSKAQAALVEEEDEDSESADEENEEDAVLVLPSRKGKKARLADISEDGGSAEDDDDDAGWESGTVDGGEDEDGDGWESGTIDEDDLHLAGSSGSGSEDDPDGSSDSDSDDGESQSDTDDAPVMKKKQKPAAPAIAKEPKAKVKAKAAASGESTFLPSLSVGFTRGDSDASDISDGEADAADAPRKNRRGQRARRAIWEKKYGRNANHVMNQSQQRDARGRDSRPQHQQGRGGPRSGRDGHGSGPGPGSGFGSGNPAHGSAAAPRFAGPAGGPHRSFGTQRSGDGGQGLNRRWGGVGGKGGAGDARTEAREKGREKEKEQALHPSWEAKKRMKEKLNPSIVPAQGKKITF